MPGEGEHGGRTGLRTPEDLGVISTGDVPEESLWELLPGCTSRDGADVAGGDADAAVRS